MKNIKIILIITAVLALLLLIGGYLRTLNKKESVEVPATWPKFLLVPTTPYSEEAGGGPRDDVYIKINDKKVIVGRDENNCNYANNQDALKDNVTRGEVFCWWAGGGAEYKIFKEG